MTTLMEQNPNSPYIEIPTTNWVLGFREGGVVNEVIRHDSDTATLMKGGTFGPRLVIKRGERKDQKAHTIVVFLSPAPAFARQEHGSIKVFPENVAAGWK